jgi:hypothetical protein
MWQDKLVDVLQVGSIISAAGFAAFALFTEFKKDGKITAHGRIAVIGIVLSALFSLGTQWGKAEIDRLKGEVDRLKGIAQARQEQDDRNEELGRYRDQINRFVGLSTQQQRALYLAEGLNGRMRLSLNRQQAVLTGNRLLSGSMATALASQENLRRQAEHSLGEIEATRSQVGQGTANTLEAMWDNANRIDPSGIQVIFGYLCPSSLGHGDTPPLFDSGAFVQIGLRPAIAVNDQDFREQIEFSPDLAPLSESFGAFQRETSARRISFSGPNDLFRFATFSLFLPDRFSSNHPFRNPEHWRNAGIEVIIFARLEMSEAALAQRARVWEARGALRDYSFTPEQLNNPRLRVSLLHCETNLTVIVNGRTIIDDHPQMMLISGWNHFQEPTVLVRSYPRRVSPDAFPYYPGIRQIAH